MAKEPRQCSCGCGEMTKGGLWRPGHDSRAHGRKETNRIANRLRGDVQPTSTAQIEWPTSGRTLGEIVQGSRVRAIVGPRGLEVDGVVYSITRYGWGSLVGQDGRQWNATRERMTVIEADPKRAAVGMPPEQKRVLVRLTQ